MPTQPPVITRNFTAIPYPSCSSTQLSDFQDLLTFHQITGLEYTAMTQSYFDSVGVNYLPFKVYYNYVMSQTINSGASCDDNSVQIRINEGGRHNLTFTIMAKLANDHVSNHNLSLFKAFDLLLHSIQGFNPSNCIFEFIQGNCFYNDVNSGLKEVVVITLKYNGVVLGYYDISIPPPNTPIIK